jgi:hypothetical protein
MQGLQESDEANPQEIVATIHHIPLSPPCQDVGNRWGDFILAIKSFSS